MNDYEWLLRDKHYRANMRIEAQQRNRVKQAKLAQKISHHQKQLRYVFIMLLNRF